MFRCLVCIAVLFSLLGVGAIARLGDWFSGAFWLLLALLVVSVSYVVRKSDQDFKNWRTKSDESNESLTELEVALRLKKDGDFEDLDDPDP